MTMFTLNNQVTTCLLILVGILSATGFSYGNTNTDNQENETFIVYYSDLNEENIDAVAGYDIAVIEPKATNNTLNEYLQSQDTKVFGYLSVMEIEHFDEFKLERLEKEDYLIHNGTPVVPGNAKNFMGDIRSENYQNMLLDLIEDRYVNEGYDGVFLDTIDYTQYYDDDAFEKDLQDAYIEFLVKANERYPNLQFFQNRGFKSYLLGASEYVDYLLYEDFRADRIEGSKYYRNLVDNIENAATNTGGKVFALARQNMFSNKLLAADLNWSFYYSAYETHYRKLPEESPIYIVSNN